MLVETDSGFAFGLTDAYTHIWRAAIPSDLPRTYPEVGQCRPQDGRPPFPIPALFDLVADIAPKVREAVAAGATTLVVFIDTRDPWKDVSYWKDVAPAWLQRCSHCPAGHHVPEVWLPIFIRIGSRVCFNTQIRIHRCVASLA